MDDKDKQIILLRAEAIRLFDNLRMSKLADTFRLELNSQTLTMHLPGSTAEKNNPTREWHLKLAQMIFIPLLEQGLDRFREEVQKVAETGKTPVV